MNARDHHAAAFASATAVGKRVDAIDWARISVDLDAQGSAVIERLISPSQCQELAALYRIDELFRSRVVMGRHGFGRGEYKYFSYPLPGLIAGLRKALYPRLAPIANRWYDAMGMMFDFRIATPNSSSAAMRQVSSGRRRCCCSTAPATTIACIRISTASTFFRFS